MISTDEYLITALKCKQFIFSKMIDKNETLYHRFRNNESGIDAHLDDYAFLIWALLELYNSTFDEQHLVEAIKFTKTSVGLFWDEGGGGFYFSNPSASQLIIRTKEFYDGAVPSGNSVMLHNLITISRITAETIYDKYINKLIDVFSANLNGSPNSSTFALTSFVFLFEPNYQLIIVGDNINPEALYDIKTLAKYFSPDIITIYKNTAISAVDYLNNYQQIKGQTTFYLCRNHTCDAPTNDIQEIIKQIL